jgi:PIN domain nuclease of toxin-antitoxin system
MKLLLDTCTFLWASFEPDALSTLARSALRAPANEVLLSAASAWEIAQKHAIGKLPLPDLPSRLVPELRREMNITDLPIDEESALRAPALPQLHRDPFDRLLVAQAITHGLLLVTPDPLIQAYGVRTLW